jgi:tetratricopeptide (TPR) repeat protein
MLSCMYPWRWSSGEGIATRRRPPKVSLTMIVRDEEKNLGPCLAAVVDLVDEVVVVDTGSRDGTRDIAEHFGATVSTFPWCDDFAAARNAALDRAHGEWILVLDADDRILPQDREGLRALLSSLPDSSDRAYWMHRVSLSEDGQIGAETEQALLFRRHADIRWEYGVHEQITPSLIRRCTVFESTGICVIHTGYRDDKTLRAKLERNYRLVCKELVARPDDPFLNFTLGSMLVALERHEEALEALAVCKPTVAPQTEMAHSLAVAMARAHAALGREQQALEVIRAERIHARGHSAVALLEAELCVRVGDLDAAAEALADLPYDTKRHHDAPHARALMLLAELLLMRQEYDKVAAIGRTLIDTRPAFGGGWFVSADAMLARDDAEGLRQLTTSFAAVRGAEAGRAVLDAALHLLAGNVDAAVDVIVRARAGGQLSGILNVVEQRARSCGTRVPVPFASCSAAPWCQP